MNEYISRDAAISKIRDQGVLGGDYDAYEREEDVVNTLKSIPAADVVEVVRCKDCAVPHNHWTGCPRMNGTIMRPDDYCSYGERREG